MEINELITFIKTQQDKVEFDVVINTIDNNYRYTPCHFSNGDKDHKLINEAGTNEGSCKIFAFAKLNNLDKDETLACFGKYYREDVLAHPEKNDHGNIRSFMIYGWNGIHFKKLALEKIKT